MILKIEDLQEVCNAILPAVEVSNISTLSETLQLEVQNSVLLMSVTNREYYVQVKLQLTQSEGFKATVNANQFLKLISQTTSDSIELTVDEKVLTVKGNGTYKIPLIFEGADLLELPKIEVNNVTSSFEIDGKILDSILKFNLKQISVGNITRPVQKLFYVDEKGAITFTSGACVNSFNLDQPIKLLLNQRLVKLFKLFKEQKVQFELGHEALDATTMQTRVKFSTDSISISAILAFDDTLFSGIPVDIIRNRATQSYPHSIVVDKDVLINTINRMKLFISTATFDAKFEFSNTDVSISDISSENVEKVTYQNEVNTFADSYKTYININDMAAILDTCTEKYITLNFGNHEAIALCRGSIVNILPEVVIQ